MPEETKPRDNGAAAPEEKQETEFFGEPHQLEVTARRGEALRAAAFALP